MKKGSFALISLFAILLLLIPMAAAGTKEAVPALTEWPGISPTVPLLQTPRPKAPQQKNDDKISGEISEETVVVAQAEPAYNNRGVLSFRILNLSTGRVEEVPLRDYVRGAVAAEMPVTFHKEALKAQAVAAHTYALYQHYFQKASPDPALQGADFSADPDSRKGYVTEAVAKAFYGPEYAEAYWVRICEAADSVLPYIMAYEEEPIVAAYHAISAGRTEAADNVWAGGTAYLQATESPGDILAPDYETQVAISRQQVENTLLTAYPHMQLPADPARWFGDTTTSASGYVTEITVGDLSLHGKNVRTLFDLRSHHMIIAYDEKQQQFVFTVQGYGHGVGLSQYGADYLARQGATFDQILEHYYSGVNIRSIEDD